LLLLLLLLLPLLLFKLFLKNLRGKTINYIKARITTKNFSSNNI